MGASKHPPKQQQQQQQQQAQQQQQRQQQQGWPHLVAGGVAGSSAVLLLHPFDVIKTRLQVQDGLPGQLPAYRGTLDAARTIVRSEGWQGLYAGLAPSLLGSTVAWGAYLYLYERIKAWHRDRQGIGAWAAPSGSSSEGGAGRKQQKHPPGQQQQQPQPGEAARLSAGWNLLSAAQAGAIVCVLTNPVWLVKTRLALQTRSHQAAGGAALQAAAAAAAAGRSSSSSSGGGAYRGMLDAFVRIGREEGLAGYYKGFGPSLVLQTTHGAIQFAAYEELKHQAARAGRAQDAPDRQLTSAEVSLYGAASKFLAAVSTYPTQVVRSRLQQRSEGRALVYSSTWQAVSVTWHREGLAGFYKGLVPSLMRVMPQSAITLMVYEGALRLLEDHQRQQQQEQQQGDGDGEDWGDSQAGATHRDAKPGQQQQQQRLGPLRQLRMRLPWQGGRREQQQGEQECSLGRHPLLTDRMSPLVIAADAQAEQ